MRLFAQNEAGIEKVVGDQSHCGAGLSQCGFNLRLPFVAVADKDCRFVHYPPDLCPSALSRTPGHPRPGFNRNCGGVVKAFGILTTSSRFSKWSTASLASRSAKPRAG